MGFGIAILALLGIGIAVTLADDDDSSSSDDDVVEGTDDPETFETGSGDDEVFADGGNDLISTGDGDDRAFGQGDDDLIFGGEGNDFIRGSGGDDGLFGDGGNDTLFGDSGDDLLIGADVFDSEGLFEVVDRTGFLPGDDAPFFQPDAETDEADTLNGGVGDDVIFAGSNDVVNTGTGFDDVVLGDWVNPDEPVQIADFDPARDAIVYLFEGEAEPDVQFGEEDGMATLEVDGESVAVFSNADAFDLAAESAIILSRLS
ncbi:calcium-binding protein [uncultured Tateyamaria sp.]|uniref:calcium-binding protein n=1 Tax=uncultured Tateyamaria sp. TaxID=455651 RepID=UPI00262A86FA|nr:hypothetical protein [uncultured Tateyamaria sp.]